MNKKVLRKLQLEEQTLLDEVERICKKNNIEYSLAYGTAIGAIRHKGFIPWDDDIDIIMTIDNYRKFEKIVEKEKQEKFYFQTYKKEKHMFLFWNKLRINNTLSANKGQEDLPLHLGICMDIFPISKYPINPKKQEKFKKIMKLAYIIIETELYKFKMKKCSKLGKIVYTCLSMIPRFLRKKIALTMIDSVLNYNGEYEYYADYSEIYNRVILMPKNIIDDEKIYVEFEKKDYPIVKKYDEYLKNIYGDYMKLPPKEQRVAHGSLVLKFSDGEVYKDE